MFKCCFQDYQACPNDLPITEFVMKEVYSICMKNSQGVSTVLKQILDERGLNDLIKNLSRILLMSDGAVMHRISQEIFEKIETKELFYDPKSINRFLYHEMDKELGFPHSLLSIQLENYKEYQKTPPLLFDALKSLKIEFTVGQK